jgi:hypothetical protein
LIVRQSGRRSAAARGLSGLREIVEPDLDAVPADDDLVGYGLHNAALFVLAKRGPAAVQVACVGEDLVA